MALHKVQNSADYVLFMTDRPNQDIISDLLDRLQLRASVYATPQVCGQWRLDSKPHGAASFHLMVRGGGWLHLQGMDAPQALRSGDLVVFPRDHAHILSDSANLWVPKADPNSPAAGATARFICGRFDMNESASVLLMEHMPPALVIHGDAAIPELAGFARFMANEVETNALGQKIVLDRLADVLFVAILRYTVANGLVARGVLAGLRDPRLAKVLELMTQQPAVRWTISNLASRVAMSRTSFAQLFLEIVGEPPIAWLTRLRMERASTLLGKGVLSVSEVARRLGYGTESAFRRAFKRCRGMGPGAVRRAAAARRISSQGPFDV